MSQWHRENPELTGTEADPWMIHQSYRDATSEVKRMTSDYCRECETLLRTGEIDLCADCKPFPVKNGWTTCQGCGCHKLGSPCSLCGSDR